MTATTGSYVGRGGSEDVALSEQDRRRPFVYVERDVVVRTEPDHDPRQGRRVAYVPDALSTLALLADSHEVVVVTEGPLPPAADGGLRTADDLPDDPGRDAWLLTTDPAVCSGERPAGVRTILVGPRRAPDRRPTAHCDLEARDLSAAVMEILVRDTLR